LLRKLHISFSLEKETFAKKETNGAAATSADAPLEPPFWALREQYDFRQNARTMRTAF
jgi:hypothetical protein